MVQCDPFFNNNSYALDGFPIFLKLLTFYFKFVRKKPSSNILIRATISQLPTFMWRKTFAFNLPIFQYSQKRLQRNL